MIIATIQKLGAASFEDSPRALIYVPDKQSALDLAQNFKDYTYGTDLRVYCAYEEHNIELKGKKSIWGNRYCHRNAKKIKPYLLSKRYTSGAIEIVHG